MDTIMYHIGTHEDYTSGNFEQYRPFVYMAQILLCRKTDTCTSVCMYKYIYIYTYYVYGCMTV